MTTNPLAAKLEVALSKTKTGQYAMTIERRLLVQIAAYLKLVDALSVTSPQPAGQENHDRNQNGNDN